MSLKNSYGLIYIGLCIRYLANVDQFQEVGHVLNQFSMLKNNLSAGEFDVSISGWSIFRDVEPDLKSKSKEDHIGVEIANEIQRCMYLFERIVHSEAMIKKVFIITKRKYDINYLMDSPEKLLSENIYSQLSEIAKYDFSASCRCILFGESTASAFHILRATEEVLKQFYYSRKKTNRLARPMWGTIISELRNLKRNKPNTSLLDTLDLIRTTYRNPTQHPDAIYDLESAQNLFGVCIDVICKMKTA